MSATEARKYSAKRFRGVEPDPNVVDAFSRNEQAKALRLLDEAIADLLAGNQTSLVEPSRLPPELVAALTQSHIHRFFASRDDYRRYRDHRGTISAYVAQAEHSIEMVSISLTTGHDLEQVTDTFEERILRRSPTRVVVSLLDPEEDYLLRGIAPVLDMSQHSLQQRINDTIDSLLRLRKDRLPRDKRECLEVWCHRVLPNASAILLDADFDSGRIQLETKGFRTGMDNSWGFEVLHGSSFYATLCDSYRNLIHDGRRIA